MKKYSQVINISRREELICHLRTLSDKNYQLKNWVDSNYAHPYWDNLRYPISMIFDELNIETEPESLLEWYLKTEEELEHLLKVAGILDRIMNEIGYGEKDSDYLDSPLHQEMVNTARQALEVFMANEEDNEELKGFFIKRYGSIWPEK